MFIKILKGVVALRESGIIHGDLKLENVLISSTETPHLVDFGLT